MFLSDVRNRFVLKKAMFWGRMGEYGTFPFPVPSLKALLESCYGYSRHFASSSRKNRPIFLWRWRFLPLKPRFGVSTQKKRLVFAGRCSKDNRGGQSPGSHRHSLVVTAISGMLPPIIGKLPSAAKNPAQSLQFSKPLDKFLSLTLSFSAIWHILRLQIAVMAICSLKIFFGHVLIPEFFFHTFRTTGVFPQIVSGNADMFFV